MFPSVRLAEWAGTMKISWEKGNQNFYICGKMQMKPVIDKTTKNCKIISRRVSRSQVQLTERNRQT